MPLKREFCGRPGLLEQVGLAVVVFEDFQEVGKLLAGLHLADAIDGEGFLRGSWAVDGQFLQDAVGEYVERRDIALNGCKLGAFGL